MRKNLILFSIFLLINFIFFEFLFSSINFEKEQFLNANYVEPEISGTLLSSEEQMGDLYQGNLNALISDLDLIGKPYIIFYEIMKSDVDDVYVYTKDYDWQFNEEIANGSYYDWMSDMTYHQMDINKTFQFQFVSFKVQDLTEEEMFSSINSRIQTAGPYSDYQKLDMTIFIYTFSILFIVLLIILQIYLENSNEEIIVLKLLGNKTRSIVFKVVRMIVLILLLTFMIISLIYIKDLYIIMKIDVLRYLLFEFLLYFLVSQLIIIAICAMYLWFNLSRKHVVDMLQGGKYD